MVRLLEEEIISKIEQTLSAHPSIYMRPSSIAKSIGLPVRDVVAALLANAGEGEDKRFRTRIGEGGAPRFALKAKDERCRRAILEDTNRDLEQLLKTNEEFRRASEIFTKAIVNVNTMAITDARELGGRMAYFYYITQQHANQLWVLGHEETAIERRTRLLYGADGNTAASFLEGILRSAIGERSASPPHLVEIPDNIILPAERQDDLLAGMIATTSYQVNLFDGREWRHKILVLRLDKVEAYANMENVWRDALAKQDYLQVIAAISQGESISLASGYNPKLIVEKLQGWGFIKEGDAYLREYAKAWVEIETDAKKEKKGDEEDTTYALAGAWKLLPTILKYSPNTVRGLLFNAREHESLDELLSRYNFALDGLAELGLERVADLNKFAQLNRRAETEEKIPVFFEQYKGKVTPAILNPLLMQICTPAKFVERFCRPSLAVGETLTTNEENIIKSKVAEMLTSLYKNNPACPLSPKTLLAAATKRVCKGRGYKVNEAHLASSVGIVPSSIEKTAAQFLKYAHRHNAEWTIERHAEAQRVELKTVQPRPPRIPKTLDVIVKDLCGDSKVLTKEIQQSAVEMLTKYYEKIPQSRIDKQNAAIITLWLAANSAGSPITQEDVLAEMATRKGLRSFNYASRLAKACGIDTTQYQGLAPGAGRPREQKFSKEDLEHVITELCSNSKVFTKEIQKTTIEKLTAYYEKNPNSKVKRQEAAIATLWLMANEAGSRMTQSNTTKELNTKNNWAFRCVPVLAEFYSIDAAKFGYGSQKPITEISRESLENIITALCGESKKLTKKIQQLAVEKLLSYYATHPTHKRFEIERHMAQTLWLIANTLGSPLNQADVATELNRSRETFRDAQRLAKFYGIDTTQFTYHQRETKCFKVKYADFVKVCELLGFTGKEHEDIYGLAQEVYRNAGIAAARKPTDANIAHIAYYAKKRLASKVKPRYGVDFQSILPFLPETAKKTVEDYLARETVKPAIQQVPAEPIAAPVAKADTSFYGLLNRAKGQLAVPTLDASLRESLSQVNNLLAISLQAEPKNPYEFGRQLTEIGGRINNLGAAARIYYAAAEHLKKVSVQN